MPQTHQAHLQAAAGAELRGFEYTKFATVTAMNLVTGRPGEICTVTADGYDYQWNTLRARWQRLTPRFGAEVTTGVTSFDDATNATHGSGVTLLASTATNAPSTAVAFWHTFCFEFGSQSGIGNLTQLAIPYSRQQDVNAGIWMRGRFSGTWSTWRRLDAPQVVAALVNLPATGIAGEIYHVTGTGSDYQWNPVLAQWVPWHIAGTVLRSNITGAASINVNGRAAAELTLTGNVTALTFTGWSTDTTIAQRVRVQVLQDATGGRAFSWQNTTGNWLESPPATLEVAPSTTVLQFYATTTDGGATVWLEPIGVSYSMPCLYMQVADVAVPAVAAGGLVTIGHDYSTILTVELVETATGRRVFADWWQTPNQPGSAVNIDFAAAHPAGTYTARVAGMASSPCQLTTSTSEWETATLAITGATSIGPVVTHDGAASDVQWVFGDGTAPANVTSGAATAHTYGSSFTGNAVLRWRRGTVIQRFVDTSAPWTFDLSALPATLLELQVYGAASALRGSLVNLSPLLTILNLGGNNTTSGDIGALPSGLTYYANQGANVASGNVHELPAGLQQFISTGQNRTTGLVSGLPATLVRYTNQGNNTTSGSVASLPAGLTHYINYGNNTTSGSVASLPAGLQVYDNQGSNTTTGSIASLPAALTQFVNTGNNTTSGSIASLPATLTLYSNIGANTTNGSVAGLPAGMTYYVNRGNNTASGDISGLPAGITEFRSVGPTAITVSAYTPPAALGAFHLDVTGAGTPLNSAAVDTILVAIDALGTNNGGVQTPDIDLTGTNQPPTATGVAARSALLGRGWTVTTN